MMLWSEWKHAIRVKAESVALRQLTIRLENQCRTGGRVWTEAEQSAYLDRCTALHLYNLSDLVLAENGPIANSRV